MTKRTLNLRTVVTTIASIFVLAFFIDLLLVIFAGAYTSGSQFFQQVVTPLISFGIAYLMWRTHKAIYGKGKAGKDSE